MGPINSSFSKRSFYFVVVRCKQLRVVYVRLFSFKSPRVVLCLCFLFNVAMR